ncbi:MAG: class I SAM-dependent methyltransferase [Pseudomonadota bacterium]
MTNMFRELATRFDLEHSSNIVDIGCGSGRLAYPFAHFLKDGRYFGCDVWEDGIRWCTDNIAAGHDNVTFHTIPSKNNYYFDDRDDAVQNEYTLPFLPDADIDLAFAISVFTHLVREDSLAYMHELKRMLKPDGCAFITAFIIDHHFFKYVKDTGAHRAVKEAEPGCFYAYSGQDFFGGYSYKVWREMIEQAGLQIVSYEVGKWAAKPGARNYQDTFVLVHEPS